MADNREIDLKKKELRLSFWTNTILVGVLGGIITVIFSLMDVSHKQQELLMAQENINLRQGDLEFRLVESSLQKIIDSPCSKEADKADIYLNTILEVDILRDKKAGQYDEVVRKLRATCETEVVEVPVVQELVCESFKHIRELGWSSGHKNNFCLARGFSGVWNFPGAGYSSGGYCYKGPLTQCAESIAASVVPK